MNIVKREFKYGDHDVVLETGGIARQATGAVMASMGNTMVLCTVVGNKSVRPGQPFFPLTVNYQEKTYAAGKSRAGSFAEKAGLPKKRRSHRV